MTGVVTIALGLSAFGYLGDPGSSTGSSRGAGTPPAYDGTAAAPAGDRHTANTIVAAVDAPPVPAPLVASAYPDGEASSAATGTASVDAVTAPPDITELTATVAPGDSLARIFRRLEIPAAELVALVREGNAKDRLSRMKPGQELSLQITGDDRLQRLAWRQAADATLVATRTPEGFSFEEFRGEQTPHDTTIDAAALRPGTRSPAATTPQGQARAMDAPANEEPPVKALDAKVKRGDSLALIFRRLGVPPAELAGLVRDRSNRERLSRIQPGQAITLEVDDANSLQRLVWQQDRITTLVAERKPRGFSIRVEEMEVSTRRVAASGNISSSLFEAGIAAGLADRTIMEMAEILGWDIDFAQDLREGDRFTVLYEEHFDDQGEKIKDGDILALEFVNRGRTVSALRFTKPSGETDYYSPDGHSMRKAFRRMPVRFGRVSSRFTTARWHPVLHRFRAHKGVDYAASRGTPILATGDGKVILRGTKGGYGKTIVIKHGERYTTLYAHMSGYGKKTGAGSRVRQGQVIGYVGSSGLATGPHVHYEFRVAGVHRDPLKVELPKALPLERRHMADFQEKTAPLLAHLERLRRTRLALNDGE
ncbi:MAG: peptidoglycan DD-metalloendopeptidase family protein [Gammaproteobacteria bacterium]|nr:peptidoglycan DD-metalloendopeptidase family protein [Gammaproteobacteria bacterium]